MISTKYHQSLTTDEQCVIVRPTVIGGATRYAGYEAYPHVS